jgi:hypothetical protein
VENHKKGINYWRRRNNKENICEYLSEAEQSGGNFHILLNGVEIYRSQFKWQFINVFLCAKCNNNAKWIVI